MGQNEHAAMIVISRKQHPYSISCLMQYMFYSNSSGLLTRPFPCLIFPNLISFVSYVSFSYSPYFIVFCVSCFILFYLVLPCFTLFYVVLCCFMLFYLVLSWFLLFTIFYIISYLVSIILPGLTCTWSYLSNLSNLNDAKQTMNQP